VRRLIVVQNKEICRDFGICRLIRERQGAERLNPAHRLSSGKNSVRGEEGTTAVGGLELALTKAKIKLQVFAAGRVSKAARRLFGTRRNKIDFDPSNKMGLF